MLVHFIDTVQDLTTDTSYTLLPTETVNLLLILKPRKSKKMHLWGFSRSSTCKEIVNVGHSFHVNFEDMDNQSEAAKMILSIAFYLHLIHWNVDKYLNVAEAFDKSDGLAIVTVFPKLGLCNENLKGALKALDSVKTKGKKAPFSDFDTSSPLPKSIGSRLLDVQWLSDHPPLHESVIWIILKEPIIISSEQLAQFRTILSSAEGEAPCPILSNHQPLKGRVVRG